MFLFLYRCNTLLHLLRTFFQQTHIPVTVFRRNQQPPKKSMIESMASWDLRAMITGQISPSHWHTEWQPGSGDDDTAPPRSALPVGPMRTQRPVAGLAQSGWRDDVVLRQKRKSKWDCPTASSELIKKKKKSYNLKKKSGYICGTFYVQYLFVLFFHHIRAIIKMKMGFKLM